MSMILLMLDGVKWSGIRSGMLWIHHSHNVSLIVLTLHHLATLHHLGPTRKFSVRFFVFYHQKEADRRRPQLSKRLQSSRPYSVLLHLSKRANRKRCRLDVRWTSQIQKRKRKLRETSTMTRKKNKCNRGGRKRAIKSCPATTITKQRPSHRSTYSCDSRGYHRLMKMLMRIDVNVMGRWAAVVGCRMNTADRWQNSHDLRWRQHSNAVRFDSPSTVAARTANTEQVGGRHLYRQLDEVIGEVRWLSRSQRHHKAIALALSFTDR